ncbi:Clock-controlled protein 6 [Cytospora mali]|uniref:Clock-controlled protein 6 n=1 Tax=Cytospora mali TaxID=578113 RepID=A0A194WD30_CYTMA|nr:Clock-controlled protein 6 [Valsa mali]
MKFSAAAVLAVAAGVSAFENVTYTTEIVTAVTTFCPEATVLTHAGSTYTISSATTLTITDCPCTITKPVTVASSVSCVTCAPAYTNGTGVYPTSSVAPSLPAGTGGVGGGVGGGAGGSTPTASTTGSTSSPIATAGAGKAAALSGAGLAGVLGLAAFFL